MRIIVSAIFVEPWSWRRPTAVEINTALHSVTPAVIRASVAPTMPTAASVPDAEWGGWVGPEARITRIWTDQTLALGGNVTTRVAAMYEYPDGGWPARSLDYPTLVAMLVRAYLLSLTPYGTTMPGTGITRIAGTAPGYGVLAALWGPIGAGFALSSMLYNRIDDVNGVSSGSLIVAEHPAPYAEQLNGAVSLWESGAIARTRTRDNVDSSISTGHDEVPDGPTTPDRVPIGAWQASAEAARQLAGAIADPTVAVLKWGAVFVGVAAAGYIGYRLIDSRSVRRTYVTSRRTTRDADDAG